MKKDHGLYSSNRAMVFFYIKHHVEENLNNVWVLLMFILNRYNKKALAPIYDKIEIRNRCYICSFNISGGLTSFFGSTLEIAFTTNITFNLYQVVPFLCSEYNLIKSELQVFFENSVN